VTASTASGRVPARGPPADFEGDETIDYAFMGQDPNAADNRWLREAFEN
jgi:hypothetical protein